MATPETTAQCRLCKRQFAKYTCPRCHVPYCSLTCYRSQEHADCSEVFYKECFMDALKERSASSHEKRRVVEMLKRLEDDDGGADAAIFDERESLEERMGNLDINSAEPDDIWDRLTKEERSQIQHAINNGDVIKYLSFYQPWWRQQKVSEDTSVRVPPLMKINPLEDLLGQRKAAFQVKFNLVNILFSYCYAVKLYNGDHKEVPLEAANAVLDLCPVLKSNSMFDDVSTAAHVSIEMSQKTQYLCTSHAQSVETLEDVSLMMTGQAFHVCAALSDLHDMLKSADRELKKAKGDQTIRKCLKLGTKKLEFFASYCSSCSEEIKAVGAELKAIYDVMSLETKVHEEDEKTVEEVLKRNRKESKTALIQEIA